MTSFPAQSLNQRRQARMAFAVARNHGRTVYLRPPASASSAVEFSSTGAAARQPAQTIEYACLASVGDDADALGPLAGGHQAARADRVYEIEAASVGAPAEGPPSRGWSLRDPALAVNGSLGVLEVLSVERGADGAVLIVRTRRSR
jgi:hypothetical protein